MLKKNPLGVLSKNQGSSSTLLRTAKWRVLFHAELGLELRRAFSGCGFAYLVNHGVDAAVMEGALAASRRFFRRPRAEKEAAFPRDPATTQGYVGPDTEMLDRLREEEGEAAAHELRESLDVNRLGGDAPFPDAAEPSVRPAFERVRDALVPLALRFLEALALSLDLDRGYLTGMHKNILEEGNGSKLRSLFYPPIEGT